MKRIYLTFFTLLTIFALTPVYAKNNVKLYMFTKNGCTACESAFAFFEEKLKEDPDAFELINIEVWCGTDYTDVNNPKWIQSDNKNGLILMQDALEHYKEDTERLSTPTIMVGDYLQIGTKDLDKLYEKIIAYQTDKKYKDVLEELASKKDIDISSLNVPHGTLNCDIRPEDSTKEIPESGKYDVIIIASIFIILVGGFTGLIIVSKK